MLIGGDEDRVAPFGRHASWAAMRIQDSTTVRLCGGFGIGPALLPPGGTQAIPASVLPALAIPVPTAIPTSISIAVAASIATASSVPAAGCAAASGGSAGAYSAAARPNA
jgi:hypothetical protein